MEDLEVRLSFKFSESQTLIMKNLKSLIIELTKEREIGKTIEYKIKTYIHNQTHKDNYFKHVSLVTNLQNKKPSEEMAFEEEEKYEIARDQFFSFNDVHADIRRNAIQKE